MSLSNSHTDSSSELLKKRFNVKQVEELNIKFENASAQEVLEWTTSLHPRVALASSFQAQGVVLIDMFMKINKKARVFTLDTGRLNEETYEVMDAIRSKYGIRIEVIFPDKHDVEEMVRNHGLNLFYKSKDNRFLCCDIRKVRPLKNYLPTLDGWITSIRRDQTENRSGSKKFEIDELHGGILKINPLVDWTSKEIWEYINEHNVPYNKLHDIGYPSIGCAPCTRAIKDGEDPRAGRWWWEKDSDKECGLHINHNINP
ncbi:MAG: phosphoadenylyl-sulfate reductase [Candidatus Dadabacteria bacterium]|nr:phosphoadenylyl-sulfate reductase [Candidatus Dadabacteria bacterium]MCZ6555742.1 phosphoadenylyl-sulfate reductase [Candidatus Dadabacteria bacterium]MCZ6863998.1 phosphoadenylyl-sulfate reductase [Candidatus Dadabacteria bacterium]